MSQAISDAIDRLEQSRRHLQEALRGAAHAPAGAPEDDGSGALLHLVAQRHPLGLVAVALLVGGAVAWSRPWRWGGGTGLMTGLCQQIAHEVVAQALPHLLPRDGLAGRVSAWLAKGAATASPRSPTAPTVQ